jgi:hypothetical protein
VSARIVGIPRIRAIPPMERPRRATSQIGGGLRRSRRTTFLGGRQAPLAPGWFTGTQPEYAIYWALERLGLKPNIDYQYLVALVATRGQIGYTEADFVIWATKIAIFVNGEFFHYEQGAKKEAFDRVQYAVAAGLGFMVVVIDAEDANRDPMYYAAEAMKGITHSRQRGLF